MATPAVVTPVRNGRRCHSFNESSIQVMSFGFQSFRRLKPARPPRRIKTGQHTDERADQHALKKNLTPSAT